MPSTIDPHDTDRDDDADYTLSFRPKRRRLTRSSCAHDGEDGAYAAKKKKGKPAPPADDDEDTEDDGAEAKKRPHLSESDVAARCFARGNHIYFFSGVSKDAVYRLQDQLVKLNNQHAALVAKYPEMTITPKPIYLHINSFGGGVFAAFAAIDFIRQSVIPVHTIIEGASASAATLMSVVGAKRYIRPHASMLIHQLSSWFGGKLTEIEDDYKNVQQMHDTIKAIYKQHTKLREGELEEMLKHDLWWKADKCLEVGLVDEVWEGA